MITEEASGRVVGEFTYPYRFFTREDVEIGHNAKFFVSDDEAVEWFKFAHPDEFKRGVEMRKYD